MHAHACNVQLDSYHDIYLQLLEECQLENLAAEVVKHFSEEQASLMCLLQQAQVTNGPTSTRVSRLDTVGDCAQKLIDLVKEFPDKTEVG